MGPAMDLISEGPDEGGQNPSPVEPTEESHEEKHAPCNESCYEVAFEDIGFCKVTWLEVMADIWLDDVLSDERPMFTAISVF